MFGKKIRANNNEVSAGSMADIAFLLLIFFLVTTTIDIDKGIAVKLPPWSIEPAKPLPENNVFTVKLNGQNKLMAEGNAIEISELKAAAKEFISNPYQKKSLPTTPKNAIISLQNDRGTKYETYVAVYNELKAAYNELWDEAAQKLYGHPYDDLAREYQIAIRKNIPLVISEAEPTTYTPEDK